MTFKFSERSLTQQIGVDERLVKAANLAITRSSVDFAFYEGLRSKKTQQENIEKGVSWTMNSKHITGQACDLVPHVGGQLRWEWTPILAVGEAFREAWVELYPYAQLRWGGCWDIVTGVNSEISLSTLQNQYVKRAILAKKTPRSDGAHWEVNFLSERSVSNNPNAALFDALTKRVEILENIIDELRLTDEIK